MAWPYANGPLHLGHIAGSLLPPDIFARYQRLRGNDVLMVSGSDMHGTPITVAAEKAGVAPEALAEENHKKHVAALTALDIHFDLFTSTATENHRAVVHELFNTLRSNGLIELKPMRAAYDPVAKRFLPDRYVEGECPHCHFKDARGDQCDSCGRTLDPQELIEPRSKISKAQPEYRDTEHFFLRLDLLQDELKKWVGSRENEAGWRPSVINFTEQWLKEGLKPRAITRDLTYGVPIPLEAGAYPEKRIYVWFEAVIGYLSAAIEWARSSGRPDAWKDFWAANDSKAYYFLGKDNIPFHTIIWPGMLLGYNRKPGKFGRLDLPWDVPANEFLQFAGAKFSKSRGNAFYVLDLLGHFDADAVRYYLIANMPEKGDTDWTWPDFVAKVNDELADVLGNYVNRVLTMSQANFGGAPNIEDEFDPKSEDEAFVKLRLEAAAARVERCEFKDGLREVLAIARFGNQRMNEQAPWAAMKRGDVGKEEAGRTLMWHLGLIKTISRAVAPFLPQLSEAIWLQLGEAVPAPRGDSAAGLAEDARSRRWPGERLHVKASQRFGPLKPLVKKLELKSVLEEFENVEKVENKMQEHTAAAPAFPKVKLEEFQRMDLRVAIVKDVRDHPKADKLYLIKVEIGGGEVRQLVAGLRGHVKPEELLGKQVVIIANLEHSKIRGEESQGMILAAEDETGLVAPLMPAKPVKQGAKIR